MTKDPEIIGPELAREYLENVAHEKRCRGKIPRTVDLLASLMKNGQWIASGNPMFFDEEGRLVDGLQRLEAVVLSGVEIEFLVCRGDWDSKQFFGS